MLRAIAILAVLVLVMLAIAFEIGVEVGQLKEAAECSARIHHITQSLEHRDAP